MNKKIKTVTIMSSKEGYNASPKELFITGGKVGGVCYATENYDDPRVSSNEAGKRRATSTASSGHHSVFDHGYRTVEFIGIPKMGAMILNSLQDYDASEKSARYTKMEPETEIEAELYAKWCSKLNKLIRDVYPELAAKEGASEKEIKAADNQIEKLAQENARQMISVFTPTVLVYTANLRQWCYIVNWCEKLAKRLKERMPEFREEQKLFHERLIETLEMIVEAIKLECAVENIVDNKDREIDFLAYQTDSLAMYIDKSHFGDSYTSVYRVSLSCLAQEQRHRTLKYNMVFDGEAKSFQVPTIIQHSGTNVRDEWLEDMQKVSKYTPQGTLVKVVERGTMENFVGKALERMCCRASLEIAIQTESDINRILGSDCVSSSMYDYVSMFRRNHKLVPRCQTGKFKCTGGCLLGPDEFVDRLV